MRSRFAGGHTKPYIDGGSFCGQPAVDSLYHADPDQPVVGLPCSATHTIRCLGCPSTHYTSTSSTSTSASTSACSSFGWRGSSTVDCRGNLSRPGFHIKMSGGLRQDAARRRCSSLRRSRLSYPSRCCRCRCCPSRCCLGCRPIPKRCHSPLCHLHLCNISPYGPIPRNQWRASGR